jgi:glutamine cyclotransferase
MRETDYCMKRLNILLIFLIVLALTGMPACSRPISTATRATVDIATTSVAPVPTTDPNLSGYADSTLFSSPLPTPLPTDTVTGQAASPLPTPSAIPAPLVTPTLSATLPISATPVSVAPRSVPVYTYRVLNTFFHDPGAFTQGLVYQDGIFYEGTGLRGRSSLRKVELETGKVLQRYDLPAQYFGEGIAVLGNKLFQLTWQSQTGFVYDKETFELLDQFTYPGEGWGLTHDGVQLIMSDGTSTLRLIDPQSLAEVGRIEVLDGDVPVIMLNELEYIAGEVWANVWQTNNIVRIDPVTGQVVGWIDLSGLLQPEDVVQPVDVLNGIAYDPENGRIFVTGKLWPRVFEIKLLAMSGH